MRSLSYCAAPLSDWYIQLGSVKQIMKAENRHKEWGDIYDPAAIVPDIF